MAIDHSHCGSYSQDTVNNYFIFNWYRQYYLNLQHAGGLIDIWSKTKSITSTLSQSQLVKNIS